MRAEVRRVLFPDVESGEPFDPANTFQLVEVYVGAVGEAGEEQYQVTACTPAALADLLRRQPFLAARHWLFVEQFSTTAVEAVLRKLIGNVEATSQAEFVERLGRIGLWEFEDYPS
ncbi:Imm8 family immunity protein [Micromonospora parva]|uniref:Imm8 family immunity protein n=1 Tax=Micromonospora parva TaxID=1464048 RepID=UPI0033C63C05